MTQMSDIPVSVALVYDKVNTPIGGAERVLEALHQIYPKAPILTSVYHPRATWAKSMQVVPSWLQQIPGAARWHRLVPFLMPLAFESLDLSGFDIVISITSAEAKGVITLPHQLHVCYLLTPTRYLYSHQSQYLKSLSWWQRPLAHPFLKYLRWWDQAAAARPDHFIPISQQVAARSIQYYHRSPEPVLLPPVSPPRSLPQAWQPPDSWATFWTEPFILSVGRLVAYKKVDLAIKAAVKHSTHLVIIGTGPHLHYLKKVAPNHPLIHFVGQVSETELSALFMQAKATIQVGQEDFGIALLESLSYGTPVIVNTTSGAAEVITHLTHGVHLTAETVSEITEAISLVLSRDWSIESLKKHVKKYQTAAFQKHFQTAITRLWHQKGQYDQS